MSQTATIELQNVLQDDNNDPASKATLVRSNRSTGAQDNASTSSILDGLTFHAQEQGKESSEVVSKRTTAIVIITVTSITAIGSFVSGILTVAIPTIAIDTHLEQGLILWPSSIYYLVCGCSLLISGSVSDAVGSRAMYLAGCFLQAIFTMSSGLAKTGTQMILFRAFSGLALAFCLPSSVSIITGSMPAGKRRNIAFATMGGGQPVGFALGLTLGGVFTQTVGWRWGFHISAIWNIVVFGIAYFGLPASQNLGWKSALRKMGTDVDWVGGGLASASLALISYVLAATTTHSSTSSFGTLNTVFLCLAATLIPTFIYWMRRQVALSRPALIPNSLWRSRAFTTVCLCVVLTFGTADGLEQILTLYFQYVRHITPLGTSLRFLPMSVSGVCYNLFIGLVAHRLPGNWITFAACSLALAPNLLFVFASPEYEYWAMEFPIVVLGPVAGDALYTISALYITASFPSSTQGLAGGVFNTCSQIGKSIGLALSAVVANRITAAGGRGGVLAINRGEGGGLGEHEESLLRGYRAAFWLFLGLNAVCVLLSLVGLRKIGKVGLKTE